MYIKVSINISGHNWATRSISYTHPWSPCTALEAAEGIYQSNLHTHVNRWGNPPPKCVIKLLFCGSLMTSGVRWRPLCGHVVTVRPSNPPHRHLSHHTISPLTMALASEQLLCQVKHKHAQNTSQSEYLPNLPFTFQVMWLTRCTVQYSRLWQRLCIPSACKAESVMAKACFT